MRATTGLSSRGISTATAATATIGVEVVVGVEVAVGADFGVGTVLNEIY